MSTLILDGSGPYAVVALSDERGEVLSSLVFEASRSLSTRLFSQIEAVLSVAGRTKNDLTALAVATGPGSFTGVRIALTTFKTMAQVMELPLVGIGTLDAYAEPLLNASFEHPVVALLHSRRNEVYVAAYKNGFRVMDPIAESIDAVRRRIAGLALDGGTVIMCGRTETVGSAQGSIVVEQRWPSPDSLARLAAKRLSSGSPDNLFTILPEYVVSPVITVPRDPTVLGGGVKSLMPGRFRSFDGVANDYDTTRVIPDKHLRDAAKICADIAGLQRGGLFLDAGVGTGRFAVPLAKYAPRRVLGLDISHEMMDKIRPKDPSANVVLLSGDLRRLPFQDHSLRGVLAVHILHIIEDWQDVLDEFWRVIEPEGVLLLGSELGGRSVLTDFYFERARGRNVLVENIGATGSAPAIHFLRQSSQGLRPAANVEIIAAPQLNWVRRMSIRETLQILKRSTFTQMWEVPADDHQQILRETEAYALKSFGDLDHSELLKAKFVLHAVRWPHT